MDPSRNSPPVAVRVMRPFPTEDALLEAESNTFTRTGVVLIGAPSRPNGVVIRFEICLQDGVVAMRGEGRVVGYRPPSSDEESALILRFTRLDVKSKSLLDRAVAMREERKSLAPIKKPTSRPPPKPPSAPPPKPASVAPPKPASVAPPKPPSAPPPKPASVAPPKPASVAPLPPPVASAPPASVAPSTERDSEDDDDAMEVDEADLTSADEDDLTVQAPPVAMMADITAPPAKERAPLPQPSPVGPTPHPVAPSPQAPPQHAPEHAPPQTPPRERMPVPQPSTSGSRPSSELIARARGSRTSGEFRPSLAPEQRDSALDRLRKRKSIV